MGINVPVRICGVDVGVAVGDTTYNNGSDSPEHLQHLGGRSSQLDWGNLTAVGRRVRDEDTPRNALEKLRNKQNRERVAKVKHEDERVQQHETEDSRPAVTNSAGDRTSQHDTTNGTNWPTRLESGLPTSFDDESVAVVGWDTEVLLESRQGDETTHEEHAVRLHNL